MESNLNHIFELQYALDTFYFLICGALVMWMAAGFSMLEAGLVRAKNTTEILTKNVSLFAIACTMYLICGYDIMYGGGLFLSGVTTVAQMDDAAIAGVLAASNEAGFGEMGEYAGASDFFFQVVFVATAMSIVSGAVAERMKLWAFLAFAIVMCGFIYPMQGSWTWNGDAVFGIYELSYSDYAGSGIVHMAGAAAALAGVEGGRRAGAVVAHLQPAFAVHLVETDVNPAGAAGEGVLQGVVDAFQQDQGDRRRLFRRQGVAGALDLDRHIRAARGLQGVGDQTAGQVVEGGGGAVGSAESLG